MSLPLPMPKSGQHFRRRGSSGRRLHLQPQEARDISARYSMLTVTPATRVSGRMWEFRYVGG